MIITRLKGGLGNQMFQYAAGLSLSSYNKTGLFIDGSFLYESESDKNITPRRFELNCFGLTDHSLEKKSIIRIRKLLLSKPVSVIRKYTPSLLPWQYVTENSFAFNPSFFSLKGNIMLDGYWQSELYFKKCRTQILDAFRLKEPLSEKSSALALKLKQKVTVSVHIRRGDLISNPGAAAVHGVCSDEYYREGLRRIREFAPEVSVIIFSDDPEYVTENMQFLNPEVIVDWNRDRNHEDLYLMQQCNHHIIANSSFSWWGAWLNPDSGKKVIAPLRWFTDESVIKNTLIPSEWQQI